jgi:hypothetical protein
MNDDDLIDDGNTELTMIAGAVIEADYVYVAQYLDRFRRVWDEVEYSRISSYNRQNDATPWMAHDLQFKAASVCVWRNYPGAKRLYVTMSDQGALELAGPGGNPTLNEVIPGAGLSKPWSQLHGYMNRIRQIDAALYACGGARQVYRRTEPGGWQAIHGSILVDIMVNGRAEMDRIRHFHDVNGAAESDIYAVGLRSDIFHYDGSEWRQLDCPVRCDLFEIDVHDPEDVVIIGRGGVVLRGNHRVGFRLVPHGGDQYFTSVIRYRDRLYLAASEGLFELDPATDRIRRCITGLAPEPVDCHRLDAADGVLWSFGNKDLLWFDGSTWHREQHPDNPPIR